MKEKKTPKIKKKPKDDLEVKINRSGRFRLTSEEALRRMNDFENRKDEFIAAIRKSKD